ncbi:methyltransferase family protein [Micromonospora sp. Llam0]|nr:methyltransferase family protein [Micromonospora sp. Llam0]
MPEKHAPHYGQTFFDDLDDGSRGSARVVVPLVHELVRPRSVLDVGCGRGSWLAEWADQGITDLLGIDGDYVDRSTMHMEPSLFRPMDLRRPFSLGRTFDLVESLEVAEHLDESCADAFVESLVRHADTVLFSAAIPCQGGTHHVNERWPSYWAERFSRLGFWPVDVVRPAIWTDKRVKRWYRQNIVVFTSRPEFERRDTCLDMVHPEYWECLIKDWLADNPAFTAATQAGIPGPVRHPFP